MLASCRRIQGICAGLPEVLGSGGLKTGRYLLSGAYEQRMPQRVGEVLKTGK